MIATRHDMLPDTARRRCAGCSTWHLAIELELREDVFPQGMFCSRCLNEIDAENEDNGCDWCRSIGCRHCLSDV